MSGNFCIILMAHFLFFKFDLIDVDECKGNHACHESANCTNTIGSHVCDCQPGYTGNGQNCTGDKSFFIFFYVYHFTDINECKGNHSCHANATCMNTKGSYVCTCHLGYTGNGSDCTGTWCISFETIFIRKKSTIILARLALPAYLVLTLSLLCNSIYRLLYNPYDVSSKNLILNQMINPKLIFFVILVTCLCDIVMIW